MVDVFDNVTCLYEAEDEGFINPISLRKTTIPPSIPDRVVIGDKESTIFIQDIYEGEGLPGVPRGTVKELRIFTYEYAYLETKSDHNWHGIQSGWDLKRMVGEYKVVRGGSALDRPKKSTSHSRRGYFPHQSVYNARIPCDNRGVITHIYSITAQTLPLLLLGESYFIW